MRRFLLLLTVAIANFSVPVQLARAAEYSDPSELFLNAYMAVQAGEKFEHDGSLKQALAKYRYAAAMLDQLSAKFSTWQPVIVDYRKKRTTENIARIQQRVGTDKSSGGSRASAEEETPLPTRDDELPPAGGMPSASAAPTVAAASADNDVEAATTQIRN